MPLLKFVQGGIYCEQGDFYIDPWKKVKRALITHAHSDHARFGSDSYLCHVLTAPILKLRLGAEINVQTVEYDQPLNINGVKVSYHPAGHVIGSAQIRIEYKGEVWVVSGDYKLENDGVATPFEPIKCNVFVSETTFGLPIYKWEDQKRIFDDINNWWRTNADAGKSSVIFGYSLGKAQRIIQNIDPSIGPILTHGSVENINEAYRQCGININSTKRLTEENSKDAISRSLIVAPPSTEGSPWLKKVGDYSSAVASGWMAVRGMRRRRAVDRGFVLSDHADWPGLNKAIEMSGAECIVLTHGYTAPFCRWLNDHGKKAFEVKTAYGEDLNIEI